MFSCILKLLLADIMSRLCSSVTRTDSIQLSRCENGLEEETAYTVEIDNDVPLPVLQSKILEVTSNPCATNEIKQNIFGFSGSNHFCNTPHERRR